MRCVVVGTPSNRIQATAGATVSLRTGTRPRSPTAPDAEPELTRFLSDDECEFLIGVNVIPGRVVLSLELRELIADSARALGLTSKVMLSGAGHDAQEIARIAPVGLTAGPWTRSRPSAAGPSVGFKTR